MKFKENHKRSLAKVISWRVLLTISHFVNGFIVTGSIAIGLQIAGWAAIINSALYWIHERVWNWVQWNRKPKDGLMFQDGLPRSTSKMITWRVLINFSNFLIPFFMTGSWGKAAAFFTIAVLVNVLLYIGHERLWNRISWGKDVVQ
jgi:uncharacterized membrane protein